MYLLFMVFKKFFKFYKSRNCLKAIYSSEEAPKIEITGTFPVLTESCKIEDNTKDAVLSYDHFNSLIL